MTHPAILSYELTVDRDYPLIMIIGREPNNSTMSDSSLGKYKFEEFPNCSFWNSAFHLFASYNGKTTSEIKQMFQKANSSPIIFTDASPRGIPNKEINKKTFRKFLTEEDFQHQLNTIFKPHLLVARVKLILLSGLEDTNFSGFKRMLYQKVITSPIVVKEISFLFGNNIPRIKEQLTEKEITLMRSIFQEFNTSSSIP